MTTIHWWFLTLAILILISNETHSHFYISAAETKITTTNGKFQKCTSNSMYQSDFSFNGKLNDREFMILIDSLAPSTCDIISAYQYGKFLHRIWEGMKCLCPDDDIREIFPIFTEGAGETPEIYEKINLVTEKLDCCQDQLILPYNNEPNAENQYEQICAVIDMGIYEECIRINPALKERVIPSKYIEPSLIETTESTKAPIESPTKLPIESPTKLPTTAPTKLPTTVPTKALETELVITPKPTATQKIESRLKTRKPTILSKAPSESKTEQTVIAPSNISAVSESQPSLIKEETSYQYVEGRNIFPENVTLSLKQSIINLTTKFENNMTMLQRSQQEEEKTFQSDYENEKEERHGKNMDIVRSSTYNISFHAEQSFFYGIVILILCGCVEYFRKRIRSKNLTKDRSEDDYFGTIKKNDDDDKTEFAVDDEKDKETCLTNAIENKRTKNGDDNLSSSFDWSGLCNLQHNNESLDNVVIEESSIVNVDSVFSWEPNTEKAKINIFDWEEHDERKNKYELAAELFNVPNNGKAHSSSNKKRNKKIKRKKPEILDIEAGDINNKYL